MKKITFLLMALLSMPVFGQSKAGGKWMIINVLWDMTGTK